MNKDLLFQLYSIHSPSNGEKKMRRFIRKYIRENCGDVEMTTDNHGNLLCVKGESESYPCLASHIDQVQRNHSKDFEVIEGKDVVFGYSAKSREQQGLGADDKNGIWVCLECLKKYDILKVAFFVGEEIGCKGSGACSLNFFKDCRYIIEPDRMHGHDLITSMGVGDVCSEDFVEAISNAALKHHYAEEVGSITDVGELVSRGVGISCINLSCGYYNAHSDEEFTVLSELENCLDFVCEMVETLTEDSYPFVYEGYRSRYGRYGGYGYNYGNTWYNKLYNTKSTMPTTPKVNSDKHITLDSWYDAEDDDNYIGYYDNGYYDMDYEMMEQIMLSNPTLSFEDVVEEGGWISNFITRDKGILLDMYDDVCEYHCVGAFAGDGTEFWDDEKDAIGDMSFDDIHLRKVS